jgi:hypothetical protein
MSDVGDEAEVKKRRTKAQLAREREIAEVAKLMDTAAGRAFVWRLLERGGFHKLSFAGADTHTTAFNEGRRDMANWVLSECLTARPQCYTVMRNEAEDRNRGEGEDG